MSGRPVLLYLPGLDGTGQLLFRQTALHERWQVVPCSYPQETPHTYEQLADDAIDRLRAALSEQGQESAVVLAESFGGAIALHLALREPGLVSRLVLLNTFAHFPRRRLAEFGAWFSRYWPARPGPVWARYVRAPFFFSPAVPGDVRAEWWKRTGPVPMTGFGYRIRLLASLDLRSRLREIETPALVIAAPDDRLVPARCGRDIAKRLPNARLVQPRIGHAGLVHPRFDLARVLAEWVSLSRGLR